MPVPELVHQRGYALCDRALPGETGIGSRAVQSQYPSGSRDIVQVIARHAAHAAFHLRKRGPPHLVLHRVSQHRSQMPQHLRLVSGTEHIQVEQAFAVIYRAVEIEHPHRVSFPLTLAPLPARQNCA